MCVVSVSVTSVSIGDRPLDPLFHRVINGDNLSLLLHLNN
jgi:hypothetical protein